MAKKYTIYEYYRQAVSVVANSREEASEMFKSSKGLPEGDLEFDDEFSTSLEPEHLVESDSSEDEPAYTYPTDVFR